MLQTLADSLHAWAAKAPPRHAVAQTVLALAEAAKQIAGLLALGPLAGSLGATVSVNAGRDEQKKLDVLAHQICVDALRGAPVAAIASEEEDHAMECDTTAPLVVAIDPLDGSSNIETNLSVGTIFSILPSLAEKGAEQSILQAGFRQLAAGFFLYGPQVALVLTLGEGTHLFVLHPASGDFLLAKENLSIPQKSQEFAINASNFRHWDKRVRAFIEDCLAGRDGPNGVDYNMRWLASVVAEAFRILIRGGIYLYPADHRQGYAQGRLRLLYEANPLAFLIEQAHGAATNGLTRIMELEPVGLHQRTPLVFGSADEVARLVAYYSSKLAVGERSPLFGRRSLFRSEEGFPGCR